MIASPLKTARRDIFAHPHRRVGRVRHASPDRTRENPLPVRKSASVHLLYIGNNPLSGKDPTGYEAEGDETPKKEPDPDLANKIDGFKVVANYGKSNRGNQGQADNGATRGQSATSTKTAAAADAGNPTTDPGSQVNGNPASPNNNGGNAIPGIPTLPTVGVNVNANGDSTVPGDWSTSMNGRILDSEWRQYNDEEETRIANKTFKALAWEAYGKPAISVGLGMYAGALIADIMYLNEGVGIAAAATGDVASDIAGESNIFRATPKFGDSGGPGAGKAFSRSVQDAARAEAQDQCVFCGTRTTNVRGPTQSNIDHAFPKSRGGNNTFDNAQNTCRTCNLEKGARTTQESSLNNPYPPSIFSSMPIEPVIFTNAA